MQQAQQRLEVLWCALDRRAHAARVGGVDPDDVRQGAAVEFLERHDDWCAHAFDGPVDLQLAALLALAVRHQTSRELRVWARRRQPLDAAWVDVARSPEQAMLDDESRGQALAWWDRGLPGMANPVYRLVLVALELPHRLTRAMVEEAAVHRGGTALARSASVTADLLARGPDRGAARRRWVAWALRLRGPFPAVESRLVDRELQRACGWLDRNLSRAKEQVRRVD